MGKLSLYYNTVKYMKPSQVFNRIRIKLGFDCSLGVKVKNDYLNIRNLQSPEQLDFDPVFLSRFPIDELMNDRITLLHSTKEFDWKSKWEFEDKSALWNFNLHYFEYLFSLVHEWKITGETEYLEKSIQIIDGWIDSNTIGTKPGWASYTISLRLVTWISWYGYVSTELSEDFRTKFLKSLHEQYAYLSRHLEKDILGNHYFENLKSLIIASLFFNDEVVLKKVLKRFKEECKEQILADGMHFELSPMYHKIIFEGMLRVVTALKSVNRKEQEIEDYFQPMLDVAYSFEEGIERVPLFNDGGNNVAKSLDAMILVAGELGYKPEFRYQLVSSGFYIFRKTINVHTWKLIVDAGQPGPKYIPGHAHCDAMSFELFCDGKPIVVNCGTYAYQCKERSFFRSAAAHNTVMIDGTEQSQCWGEFRLAKRSSTKVLDVTDDSISMEMKDQKGRKVKRTIEFADTNLSVTDTADGHQLISCIHIRGNVSAITTEVSTDKKTDLYAVDYGETILIPSLRISSENQIDVNINLKELVL